MKEDGRAPRHIAPPDEAQTSERQPFVLVVENNNEMRKILRTVLGQEGYSIVTAATVIEAESVLQQWGDSGLSLVISDINLTRSYLSREGYAFYQRWKERYPTLPYLLMSADPTNQCLPAIRQGHVRFMEKPFRIGTLINHVRELLDQTRPPMPSTLSRAS